MLNEEWIEIQPATAIVSKNSNRNISTNYVRLLAYQGRIKWKQKDGRQNLYLKSDVESISVKRRAKEAQTA